MNGPLASPFRCVAVQAVDADTRNAGVAKSLGCTRSERRVIGELLIGAPVDGVPGPHQHRLVGEVRHVDILEVDRRLPSPVQSNSLN